MRINKKLLLLIPLLVLIIGCILVLSNKNNHPEESLVSIEGENISSSNGRGFIYKKVKDGYYILTNNHVIRGCKDIKVTIGDDVYNGQRVGIDDYLDLAIIRINTNKKYKVLKFGNSNNSNKIYNYNESVFMEGTIIEEKIYPVSINQDNDYGMELIKTNIKISEGFSGSALFNSKNQVVGIVTLKDEEGNAYVNSYKSFKKYLSILEEGNAIERPSLGITMANAIDKELIDSYKLDINTDKGVVVIKSSNNSLEVGDVIIGFDNKEIESIAYLRHYLYKMEKDSTVKIKIIRNNEEIDKEITLL